MSFFNIPVAKRTRSQWELYWQLQGSKRRKHDQVSTEVYKSSVDECDGEEKESHRSSDENGSIESTKTALTENSSESDIQTYSDSSDDSDSDSSYTVGIPEEGSKGSCRSTTRKLIKVKTVDKSSKDHKIGSRIPSKSTVKLENLDESSVVELSEDEESSGQDEDLQDNTNTYSFESTEDDESESDKLDDCVFSPVNKRPNQPSNKKQSPIKNANEKDYHSVHKTIIKKVDKKTKDEPSDINVVKNRKSKKTGRIDDGGSVNAILDSIIGKESVNEKEGDYCHPLKFRFDDSEDEFLSQETNDFGANGLFEEMDFALDCEEIGSYKTPTVKDNNVTTSQSKLCEFGDHGDIYFEEQTGMRCRLCRAVILETRYVMPKLANYAADRSKRSYVFDEQQLGSYENMHFKHSDSNHLDVCRQTTGTVWELIPMAIRAHLYPHQQEGFEFLWKNLAGTIDLSRLRKLGPGGGGCIISHAPGTGKTLLTIVFIDSFLKKFPRCCPVIIAPANMLLTWEAEFSKWQVGFSFINLNNYEVLCKEAVNGGLTSSRRQKDMIRAMKIKSWSNGGSVLGVSYNLYGKLAGDTKFKNSIVEKMGNVLLDMPGLVVLDEGHTPRNQNSIIWNTLLRLKTKNRVILSGTPFQNNFRELFNTLRLVRPATAMNEKNFADMIHQNKRKKSRIRSTSEDIERLKVIIKPFVHVHKGDILENKLPGLKQTVVLLNPSSLQKGFIENLEKFSNTFEHEHKVALVSVHPSLILHCSLSKKEEKSTNKKELEKGRLYPELGVKTRFVMELVRLSISLHEKVLIFSQYIQPLELLKDQMTLAFGWYVEREIAVIKGHTRHKLRQTIINDFNDPNSKVKVLLASTKCCSEGIHLYGASRVVLLDVVWNPSVEKQAISRAYRIGQKKVVYTYHLMTAGTTEEEKYDRQVEKGRLAEKVFSSRVVTGEEPMKKVNVTGINVYDKVLERMVNHQELKGIFKKITHVENQRRI